MGKTIEVDMVIEQAFASWKDNSGDAAMQKLIDWLKEAKEAMEDATDEEPELGNLLFGHSRGAFRVHRFPAQRYFGEFFERCGMDSYGHPNRQTDRTEESPLLTYEDKDGMVDTELFSVWPYYWGDDEEKFDIPNFVYKPENIKIRWYKYALRDAYSNVPLTGEKIKEILDNCTEYVQTLRELPKAK